MLHTYEEVNLFYRLADAFEIANTEAELAGILLQELQSVLASVVGAVVLDTGEVRPLIVTSTGTRLIDLPAVKSELDSAMQRGVVTNTSGRSGDSPDSGPYDATIVAPILLKGEPVGAVILQRESSTFDAGEVKVVRTVGTQAGVFINSLRQAHRLVQDAELRRQVEIAETIQRQLLPEEDLDVEGMEIASYYLASNKVGGDYYDANPSAFRTNIAAGLVFGEQTTTALT